MTKATSGLVTKNSVDNVTILTATSGLAMAKTWLADGAIKPYSKAKNFKLREVEVGRIVGLSALLDCLADQNSSCVIRGEFIGDELAKPLMQSEAGWSDGHVLRRKSVFKDCPRHVMMIDIDNFRPTLGDPVLEPRKCIDEYIEKHLPKYFYWISYHWQLSNSAGHPSKAGVLKAHVWFWLETPRTSAELALWARENALDVDKSLFDEIQIHYTANPVFHGGAVDPIPVRSGLELGFMGDSVELDIVSEPHTSSVPPRKKERPGAVTTDPVAQRLYDLNRVRNVTSEGALNIECPLQDQHSEGVTNETAARYYPAHTGGYKRGVFHCMHAHCKDVNQFVFKQAIGIEEDIGFDDVDNSEEMMPKQADVELTRLLIPMLVEAVMLYVHGLGWVQWRHGVYVSCRCNEQVEIAKRLGSRVIATSSDGDPEKAKRICSLAVRAQTLTGISAALKLAESDPRLAVRLGDFDADPDLWNVANGCIHLPTQQLLPHNHRQRFLKQCPVHFDPQAPAPRFETFMLQISKGDPDWVDYAQRVVGHAMSGRISEEVAFFLLGLGANGKSVFCSMLRHVAGPYAVSVPTGFLMQSKFEGNSATPALAALMGARFAFANEVESGARLSPQALKVATSTDAISARRLYHEQFEFTPTHTLFVRTNHKPIISDNDHGLWRRIKLIPFDQTFEDDQKDNDLEEKLKAELPGILAWMVRGYAAYRERKLRPAKRVEAASLAYRAESDLVTQWLDEYAERAPEASWPQKYAYKCYQDWCAEQGLHAMSQKGLTLALAERQVKVGQVSTGDRERVYLGIRRWIDPSPKLGDTIGGLEHRTT